MEFRIALPWHLSCIYGLNVERNLIKQGLYMLKTAKALLTLSVVTVFMGAYVLTSNSDENENSAISEEETFIN